MQEFEQVEPAFDALFHVVVNAGEDVIEVRHKA